MSLVLRKYTLEIYTEIFKGTGAMMYATYSQKVQQKMHYNRMNDKTNAK